MKTKILIIFLSSLFLINCSNSDKSSNKNKQEEKISYLDNEDRDDIISGGVKMIEISTPKGNFKVWTKRVGNNPQIKVLLLHGGPGSSHRIYTCFDSYFPEAGIEYYYYD